MRMFRAVFRSLRALTGLVFILFMLSSFTTVWAIQQTARASAAVASLKTIAEAHRTELADRDRKYRKQLAKTRAKGRLRRGAVAIPLAGIALAAGFEEMEWREWSAENPDRTRLDYACSQAEVTMEVIEEVTAEAIATAGIDPASDRAGWLSEKFAARVPDCDKDAVAGSVADSVTGASDRSRP